MAAIFQRVPWRSLNPNQFRTETDRKYQHANAAHARNQEMAKLVEEHDNRQNKQERNEIPDYSMAKRHPDIIFSSMYFSADRVMMFLQIRLAIR